MHCKHRLVTIQDVHMQRKQFLDQQMQNHDGDTSYMQWANVQYVRTPYSIEDQFYRHIRTKDIYHRHI